MRQVERKELWNKTKPGNRVNKLINCLEVKSMFVILPLSQGNWSSLCSLTDVKAPSCTASRRASVCNMRQELVEESINIEIHFWKLHSKRLGCFASMTGRSYSSPIFTSPSPLSFSELILENMYFGFPAVGDIPFWSEWCYFWSPGTFYILLFFHLVLKSISIPWENGSALNSFSVVTLRMKEQACVMYKFWFLQAF